jgi:soluble lytic murein transglycosylase-like protein
VDSNLDPIYQAAAQEWNVDPSLLRAVASVETGGAKTPNSATSPRGAQGLMQIMPQTQAGLGVTNPNDPTQSIYGGAKYLSQMLDRYKTPELALAAYNAGPDRVDAHLATGAPLPNETLA